MVASPTTPIRTAHQSGSISTTSPTRTFSNRSLQKEGSATTGSMDGRGEKGEYNKTEPLVLPSQEEVDMERMLSVGQRTSTTTSLHPR